MLITGGMSYGDPPTEAEPRFSDINECDPLYSELAEYAREDWCGVKAERAKARRKAAPLHASPGG